MFRAPVGLLPSAAGWWLSDSLPTCRAWLSPAEQAWGACGWGGESWVKEGKGLPAVLLVPDPTSSQSQQPGLDSEAVGRGEDLLRHEIL